VGGMSGGFDLKITNRIKGWREREKKEKENKLNFV